MREHRYTIEMPHSPARLWALFQDYDNWFEGPIYRFINKKNEASMQRAAAWLTEHPEYRPDLVEP